MAEWDEETPQGKMLKNAESQNALALASRLLARISPSPRNFSTNEPPQLFLGRFFGLGDPLHAKEQLTVIQEDRCKKS